MGILEKLGLEMPTPATQQEKAFLEKLSLFVMRNLNKVSHLKLKDTGFIEGAEMVKMGFKTEDGGIYFTLVGNKDMLEAWLKMFPEHKAIIEQKMRKDEK